MIKIFFRRIIINILLICLILVSIDYAIYNKYKIAYYRDKDKTFVEIYPFPSYINIYRNGFSPNTIQYLRNNQYHFRPFNIDKNNTKGSILIFGCSFAYSYLLEDSQTISYKLSQYTKRNVFNFGMCACGIQHMLYLIQKNFWGLLDNKVNQQQPEYAIFIYIPDHLQRIQYNLIPGIISNGINLQYEIKNSNLEIKQYPSLFLYKSFLVKSLYTISDMKKKDNVKKSQYDNFMLANEIFLESKRLLEEKYPNIKFVILNYQREDDGSHLELPFMWDVLKKEGFIVINTQNLIGRKFKGQSNDTTTDGLHPSEEVWNALVPKLVEKLKL